MIEVTQRNLKGNEQIIGFYTEEEFGKHFRPDEVRERFSNSSIERYKENTYLPSMDCYIKIPVFSYVAYNDKGKLLTVDYLVGISKKYRNNLQRKFRRVYHSWAKPKWHSGSYIRHMRTTQEKRWANAWDDEEFAPKVRARRNANNLIDVRDDIWRHNQKNWKKFRKHQWRD